MDKEYYFTVIVSVVRRETESFLELDKLYRRTMLHCYQNFCLPFLLYRLGFRNRFTEI